MRVQTTRSLFKAAECLTLQINYIPICGRVVLAASDVQSISDIPATDEIHIEYQIHSLNRKKLMAHTKHKSVNRRDLPTHLI